VLSPAAALAVQQASDHGDRAAADSLVLAWDAANASDPLPALARLQLAWWDILEGRDATGERERVLDDALGAIETRAAVRLRTDADDAVALWALGEAHCAHGRLAGLRGHAWAALRHHQRGIAALETLRRHHPDLPEPRASIGLFRYYTARLPGPVRMLARLVRVRGDRVGGLADLRAAAAAPGVQQQAARFFLAQILNDGEADDWEALEHALRAHQEAPARVAIVLKLADVLVDLDRPDVAVRWLEQAAARGDAAARVQCAFLAGRVESDTGLDARARARFDAIGAADVARVTWLAPWLETYRGIGCAAAGDAAAARRHWRRVAALDDVAGSRAAATEAAARFAAPAERVRRAAHADLVWDGDPARAWARLQAARAAQPPVPRTTAAGAPAPAPAPAGAHARAAAAFDLTCARAALHAGAAAAAAPLAARAAAQAAHAGDDAGLLTRARVRWLQSLLWAGDHAAAARAAAALARDCDPHATPRPLAWLIQSVLDPAPPAFAAAAAAATTDPRDSSRVALHVRLVDTGFTSVDVVVAGYVDPRPLVLERGAWTGTVYVRPGRVHYRFRVEGRHPVLDPAAPALDDVQGEPWSVRDVEPAAS